MVAETPLVYAGTASTYHGQLTLPAVGSYGLEVLALDASEANFGRVSRSIVVQE